MGFFSPAPKWVPDKQQQTTRNVTRLLKEQKAAAARQEQRDKENARKANPTPRSDKGARRR